MKEIDLSKGQGTRKKPTLHGQHKAQVDDDLFEYLNQFNWTVYIHGNTFYAYRSIIINGKRTKIALHREIMSAKKGELVDHRDRNGLNCTRSNLRIATHSQNSSNKKSSGKHSKYLGVSFHKLRSKWTAAIEKTGKTYNLGHFMKEEDAAKAYDLKAKELHGEFANLNFP